jgi:hypothetical protein
MFNLMLAIDWESINWSAVGAIGTAIGSIATAIAVIVAIIQLKQPNKKLIRVDVYKTVDLDIGIVVGVNIINAGNRDVQLRSVHYIVRGKEEILIPINYEAIKSTVKIDSAIQVEYKYKNTLNLKIVVPEGISGKLILPSYVREVMVDGVLVKGDFDGKYYRYNLRSGIRIVTANVI